jgi:hypothetical protein
MNIVARRLLIGLFPIALTACGGGSSNTAEQGTAKDPDYSQLKQVQPDSTPLRPASDAELSRLIKNGLRLSLHNNTYDNLIRTTAFSFATESAAQDNSFSTTNVQIAGVDEADFVKYDGKRIYLVTPVEHSAGGTTTHLKIFATDAAGASVKPVSDTALDTSGWGAASELYLVNSAEDQTAGVVTVRRSWELISFNNFLADTNSASEPIGASLPYPGKSGINVTVYDVRDPTAPSSAWSMSLDGDLLGSRKIGNVLYLVSSFVPVLEPLNYGATTTLLRQQNERLIEQTAISQLLPQHQINSGAEQPLNSASECLVSADAGSDSGHLNMVNITAIDLQSYQLIESICVNTLVQGIYVSPTNIYLGSSDFTDAEPANSATVIHKFSLGARGIDYEATGAVPGVLGWNSPSFRMDEHDGDLRIVTTSSNADSQPQHHLTVLRQNAATNKLQTLAQIPNTARPQIIGKPNEDIYAVRFKGDKAYVVTFERIDPLYVIELSDPADPFIAGELEVPGFSTYLHPIDEQYLFALGNEVDRQGTQTGVKISLFDVQDIANPALIESVVLGNQHSWSEAIYAQV